MEKEVKSIFSLSFEERLGLLIWILYESSVEVRKEFQLRDIWKISGEGSIKIADTSD